MANEIADINKVLVANAAAINGVSADDIAAVNGVNWAASKVMKFNSSYHFYWEAFEYGYAERATAYVTITPDATFACSQPTNFTRALSQASNYMIIYPTTANPSTVFTRTGTSTLTASGYSCTGDCTVSLTQYFDESSSSEPPVCLTGDTLITMANGKKKKIADIKAGDKVLSTDFKKMKHIESTVKENKKMLQKNLAKIKWSDGEVICTTSHPFFLEGKRWSSLFPGRTNKYYPNIPNHCQKMEVGDKILTINGFEYIESIIFIEETVPTWQIMQAEYNTYYANDLLTLIR